MSDFSMGQLVQAPNSKERALEFQLGTLKLTCHRKQVHHDHITIFTWFTTHIIVHRPERSNFSKRVFQFKIQLFCSHEKPYKTTYLGCTKHSQARQPWKKDSRSIDHQLQESESFHEDLPIRHNLVKSPLLHLIFSSSSELEESSLKKSKSLKAANSRDMIF
jgi:hypothetical protein